MWRSRQCLFGTSVCIRNNKILNLIVQKKTPTCQWGRFYVMLVMVYINYGIVTVSRLGIKRKIVYTPHFSLSQNSITVK